MDRCLEAVKRGTLADMIEAGERVYRVSEITTEIKSILESSYPRVSIEGEISNFRPSSSGHYYFTLKDRDAMISAVMFKNRALRLVFQPKDGQLVVARGSLSVYPQRGTYQIVCESIDKAGEGDILAMLEERKRRLAAEGLFDMTRKRPLPPFPERIAVVTSPTGAAIRDILKVLKKRNAGMDGVVLPAPVQGEGSEVKIAAQIARANRYRLGDVIIVGRGGGSLEDLLPFSAEVVVRAIADSAIPVSSAVGHEVDVSLSDLAADYRAPTPSAAAEAVSKARDELLKSVEAFEEDMRGSIERRIDRVRLLLEQFSSDNLERHLRMLLQPLLFRLDDAKEKLVSSMKNTLVLAKHRYEIALGAAESCSPFEILKRGYAIVRDRASGRFLVSAKSIRVNDEISIRFHEGEIDASVTKTAEEL